VNHNYVVLEKHKNTTEHDNDEQKQIEDDQDHYHLPNDSPCDNAAYVKQDDDYDTTDQSKRHADKPGKPGNVYNTFNDFQQHDDYNHLGDHKKLPRVRENEYNTTKGAMAPAIDGDTYNYLNEGPKTTLRPDNVLGMSRVDDDYNRMPPVCGTKTT